MTYQCELKETTSQPVLSVRTRTSIQELPNVMAQVYPAISQYLEEQGEQPAGAPFAAYYNMDVQDLDVEIGIPVAEALAPTADFQASVIPGGRAATCIHVGPYSAISQAYEALEKWVQENGYQTSGTAYEMYIDDPGMVPEEELRTLVLFPLLSS
jgi:effector-binding domain-containing protein